MIRKYHNTSCRQTRGIGRNTNRRIWKWLGINNHWATHCQKCPNIFDRLKNMAARGWDQLFSYVNIGITLKIFLLNSTWSIENNSTLMVMSDNLPRLLILSVEKHDYQGWSLFFLYWKNCYKSSCQNTTWSNCFGNIIKVSNSLDPKGFGPNCLQMLSVEKTLARVKRSCQKFLGYLKKKTAHMIFSVLLPWLFKLWKSIKNGHQGHLHVYSSVCLWVSNCNCYWSGLIQSWFIWHI